MLSTISLCNHTECMHFLYYAARVPAPRIQTTGRKPNEGQTNQCVAFLKKILRSLFRAYASSQYALFRLARWRRWNSPLGLYEPPTYQRNFTTCPRAVCGWWVYCCCFSSSFLLFFLPFSCWYVWSPLLNAATMHASLSSMYSGRECAH